MNIVEVENMIKFILNKMYQKGRTGVKCAWLTFIHSSTPHVVLWTLPGLNHEHSARSKPTTQASMPRNIPTKKQTQKKITVFLKDRQISAWSHHLLVGSWVISIYGINYCIKFNDEHQFVIILFKLIFVCIWR